MLQFAAQLLPQDKGSAAQCVVPASMQSLDPYPNMLSDKMYPSSTHATLDIWSTLVDSTHDTEYDMKSSTPENITIIDNESHMLFSIGQSHGSYDTTQSHGPLEDSGVAPTIVSRDSSPESNTGSLSGSLINSPQHRGMTGTPKKCRLAAKFHLPLSPTHNAEYQ